MDYIFLVFYSLYGGTGDGGHTTSHKIAYYIVIYLMGGSLDLYILCKIRITRTWLENLLGKDYIINYKVDFNRQLLKFWSVPFVFKACDIATLGFAHKQMVVEIDILHREYDQIYGSDPQKWDEHITAECTQKHSDIIKKGGAGIITQIAHKLNI